MSILPKILWLGALALASVSLSPAADHAPLPEHATKHAVAKAASDDYLNTLKAEIVALRAQGATLQAQLAAEKVKTSELLKERDALIAERDAARQALATAKAKLTQSLTAALAAALP